MVDGKEQGHGASGLEDLELGIPPGTGRYSASPVSRLVTTASTSPGKAAKVS